MGRPARHRLPYSVSSSPSRRDDTLLLLRRLRRDGRRDRPGVLSMDEDRLPFDVGAYERRSRSGVCFVCAIVAGHPDYPAHVIFRDERHIAFLNRWPTLRGYSVLAPVDHRQDVLEDFSLEEYLDLQAALRRLGRAIRTTVPTERLYVLSLGSLQGNSHVHWHLAPLPPGVPYERQQFHALMAEHAGLVPVTDVHQAALARQIRAAFVGDEQKDDDPSTIVDGCRRSPGESSPPPPRRSPPRRR